MKPSESRTATCSRPHHSSGSAECPHRGGEKAGLKDTTMNRTAIPSEREYGSWCERQNIYIFNFMNN